MTAISERIDVTLTSSGRLVLLAEGASPHALLAVRLSGGVLEIADGRGPIARAPAGDAAAVVSARRQALVILLADGRESLHESTIRVEA